MTLNIHEELHRLILRKRWILWSQRNYRWGCYKRDGTGKHSILSERLSAVKPMWEQRNEPDMEMDK